MKHSGWCSCIATLCYSVTASMLKFAMIKRCSLLCVLYRVYAHALLVLDDADFHDRQDVFTLSQQRGIATALNALVFRTYFPNTAGMNNLFYCSEHSRR